MDWLPEFVREHLSFKGKCFRHCDKPTSMRVVAEDSTSIVGAYVCPDGFVSQVVYFSQKPDLKWFTDKLEMEVGKENFTSNDVRVASRHGWELGGNAFEALEAKAGTNSPITEVYWTRYARTDAAKQIAISLCVGDRSRSGCLKLFAHDRNPVERFCPACKSNLTRS
ncbi:MAG: hypothetical protein ACLP5V_07705 [Candidatus Bathyarchaeia archaeon]